MYLAIPPVRPLTSGALGVGHLEGRASDWGKILPRGRYWRRGSETQSCRTGRHRGYKYYNIPYHEMS
ncbi:hypothetical protein HOLleu_20559 [Holothuria leucospilota]|uniref:Uncharacterized protein n=1 Tax=Holothuria leucospilota TaxID=206669 RepID=A0A9Q1C1Q4_HOLLE|nr:hypothetical protein HOLleu_20559 [Holothuria leucospilota]